MASLQRAGLGEVVVLNRDVERARALAASVGGRCGRPGRRSASELVGADVVVSCTGATGVVLDRDLAAPAVAERRGGRPLVVLDLALPHDVDPAVGRARPA